jgi:flagellar biosynthesis protein FliR
VEKIRSFVKAHRRSYVTYAVGCAIAWAVVLTILASTTSGHRMTLIWCIFFGWIIGWISATIARFVYPPPAKWLRDSNG